jgi:hypothetical protein
MKVFVVIFNTSYAIDVSLFREHAAAISAANSFAKEFYKVDNYQQIEEVSQGLDVVEIAEKELIGA